MTQSTVVENINFQYADTPRVPARGGAELYTERRGQGPAIVVLNNFFMASPVWRSFTSRLEQSHTIISYDFRGQGASSAGEVSATWEDHVEDLGVVFKHHNLTEAYLLGTSISAVMCRDFAIRNPKSTRGLIMAGPALSPWGARRHRRIIKSWLSTLQSQGMQALFDQMFPVVFGDAMIESMGAPGYLALRESFLVLHTQDQIEASLSVSLTCDAKPDVLKQVAVPTQLLVGDDDFGWSASAVAALDNLVPDLTTVVVPKAGHLPFLEATERFEIEVASFIDSIERRNG